MRSDHVTVVIEKREPVHVFWVLMLLVLIVAFWKWILFAATVFGILATVYVVMSRRKQRIEGLRSRADEQHNWVFAGDERGIYGHDWTNHEGLRTPASGGRGPVPKPGAARCRRTAE